jgi:hypothetical protein
MFARVMFAPAILATVNELADYYRKEIARDAAITAKLWIRSKHGTRRFFMVTPDYLVEIDSDGKADRVRADDCVHGRGRCP